MPHDLFDDCYDAEHRRAIPSPEKFRDLACRRCRNYDCVNVGGLTSKFYKRVTTQVDRIFTNPRFTDPNDPAFAHIRNLDFRDMFREAMRLEIADQKGDWEIPTEADAMAFAAGTLSTAAEQQIKAAIEESEPEPVEPEFEDTEPERVGESELVVVWETEVFGTRKKGQRLRPRYRVALEQEGNTKPAWVCKCGAFQHRKDPADTCKHIQAMIPVWLSEEEAPETPVEVSAEPEVPVPAPRTQAVVGPGKRGFRPNASNTPFPSGGMSLDGGTPQQPASEPHDPWAVPHPDERTIPVGGKIRLGMTGKKKE